MGRATADALAENVTDYESRERAVRVHLRSNCFPPMGEDWVRPALDAIDAVSAEDHGEVIDFPNGLSASAAEAVRTLHLDAFLYGGDFEDMDDDEPFEVDDDDED